MKSLKYSYKLIILLAILIKTFAPCYSNEKDYTVNNYSTITNMTSEQSTSIKTDNQPELNNTLINPQEKDEKAKIENKTIVATPMFVQGTVSADGKVKRIDNSIQPQERREHIRFNITGLTQPVLFKTETNNHLIDISRSGIGISHNNTVKLGEILPVRIEYKGMIIDVKAEVVSRTANRAGAKFITQDNDIADQLLYLSVLLESDNNMLGRRINQ